VDYLTQRLSKSILKIKKNIKKNTKKKIQKKGQDLLSLPFFIIIISLSFKANVVLVCYAEYKLTLTFNFAFSIVELL
jgi:hypothetical protein|tara:strand:+ start:217 stop:447 length:231 start_codon:yes stop_codon:yes gene_type:complete